MGIHAKIRFQTQMLMLVMMVYSCNPSTSQAKAGDRHELRGQLRLQGQTLSQTKQMKQQTPQMLACVISVYDRFPRTCESACNYAFSYYVRIDFD